jgi:adenylate cyclase class IV
MARPFLIQKPLFLFFMCAVRSFQLNSILSPPIQRGVNCFSTMTNQQPHGSLEVEVKFSLMDRNMDELKRRIKQLNFVQKGACIRMVDWYFDTPGYDLARQDCWLRFRHRNKEVDHDVHHGQWELKRGRRTVGLTTTYEEIEGLPGFETALSLLPEGRRLCGIANLPNDLSGYCIPSLPYNGSGFLPLARIYTERLTYKSASSHLSNLSIDLDTSDDHAVGEIEALVATDSELPNARSQVANLLEELLSDETDRTLYSHFTTNTKGKLEIYIEKRRPELYKMLVASGIMC